MPKSSGKEKIRKANINRILVAAEQVFANSGFKGATMDAIANLAGVPKANVHYYFATKAALYHRVIEDVCDHWLLAALPFDQSDDPATALAGYICAKMDQARQRPFGSRLWAMEIIRGAPAIKGYLHTQLKPWFEARTKKLDSWIAAGKMHAVDPHALLYMIWASTQHYADFSHQINVLNDDQDLSDGQFSHAKDQVCQIILTGVGLQVDHLVRK